MPLSTTKLALPTTETCRWRRVRGDGTSAECGLLSSLTGIRGGELSAVSDEACVACCRSFPPSPRRLNPVVASLLYDATCRILAAGGTAQCSPREAAGLRGLAERSLDLVHPEHLRLTPARSDENCCWLGEVVRGSDGPDNPDAAGCGPALLRADEAGEPTRVCRHASHKRTTPSGCRLCRDWALQPPISRFMTLDELVPAPSDRHGPAVRSWAFGVTTSPRREPTLEACLDAIVRAGWDQPRLFLDGTVPVPPRYGHLPVTWREDPVGAWPAWYLALAELLLQQPDADAYVLVQDDVVLYDRESLREYLERVLWPGDRPCLVSLFYTGSDPVRGWRRADGVWHWGAQGFVLPPGVARAFLTDAAVSGSWLAASSDGHIPIPNALDEWVRRTEIDVWYASPSLSQHIGNTSTIWMDAPLAEGRRALWFTGSIESAFAKEETLAGFPEDAFPCHETDRNDYHQRVERGRRRARERTAVICGLCRDVRHHLPRTAARVERLGQMFRDYRVVLFENDSLDATREFLFDWQAANPRVDVISESLGAPRYPQVRSLERAAWMAECRNRCRERIVREYADFDCVVVLDTDLPGGWSFDGVAHTFGEEDWDFVGSYGLMRRPARRPDQPPYLHVDVWAFHPARGTPARKLVNHNELHLRRGDPLLPVESCFGGLGVYRTACLIAAEYGGGDCEHVVFHNRLRRAGLERLFMNPSQIVSYSPL